MNLIERLTSCGREALNEIPYLNNGGCGVYAANVAMALSDLGVTVWGIAAGYYPADASHDLNVIRSTERPLLNVNEWEKRGADFGHVLVQFEYLNEIWTHDTKHTVCKVLLRDPTFNIRIFDGYLTVPELVAIASDALGWNKLFNRSKHMRKVTSIVQKHLTGNQLELFDSYRTAA